MLPATGFVAPCLGRALQLVRRLTGFGLAAAALLGAGPSLAGWAAGAGAALRYPAYRPVRPGPGHGRPGVGAVCDLGRTRAAAAQPEGCGRLLHRGGPLGRAGVPTPASSRSQLSAGAGSAGRANAGSTSATRRCGRSWSVVSTCAATAASTEPCSPGSTATLRRRACAFAPNEQLAFNRWLAEAAHQRGLAVGIVNDLDQAAELATSFDFLIADSCVAHGDCTPALPVPPGRKASIPAGLHQHRALDGRALRLGRRDWRTPDHQDAVP